MPKEFLIKAGEKKRVLWVFSSSIPGTPRFKAGAVDGGEVTGKVEVARRRWFEWQRENVDLHPRNVFEKGFSDADYRIYVTPDRDTRIIFETRHMRAELYFRILAAVLILGLISGVTAWIFADPATPSQN
ncbi:MAG: hypothetical protein AAF557_04695 [Pseudomonadota bacterium]